MRACQLLQSIGCIMCHEHASSDLGRCRYITVRGTFARARNMSVSAICGVMALPSAGELRCLLQRAAVVRVNRVGVSAKKAPGARSAMEAKSSEA